ncbi:MAG: heme ABC transporter ATP-binding protein [Myxococcales bacterium]|nr:heme ABC transporter ATP-binding protein [Myxococcales bacterium]
MAGAAAGRAGAGRDRGGPPGRARRARAARGGGPGGAGRRRGRRGDRHHRLRGPGGAPGRAAAGRPRPPRDAARLGAGGRRAAGGRRRRGAHRGGAGRGAGGRGDDAHRRARVPHAAVGAPVVSALESRCLTVHRGDRAVLREVDVRVRPGQVVAVVGPNGAGKSTLLGALAGDLRPASGAVLLDGEPLGSLSPRALARRRAVMRQDATLAFPFPVAEVVLMGRLPHGGRGNAADHAAVDAALRRAGAAHLAARPFPGLSGGERQRVSLARALAQVWGDAPAGRYLLLDEPTAALDLGAAHAALACARAFAAAGGGVLCVLHDLNEAVRYADEVVLLGGGRRVAAGRPGAVLRAGVLSTVYGVPVEILEAAGGRFVTVAPAGRAEGEVER